MSASPNPPQDSPAELRSAAEAIIDQADLLISGIYSELAADQEQSVRCIRDHAEQILESVGRTTQPQAGGRSGETALTLPIGSPLGRRRGSAQAAKQYVLIVDDDPNIREILRCVLTEQGYHVSEAADGKQAMEKLTAIRPDLLILDLHIPKIDGWDVMRFIPPRPDARDTKVLVISGDVLDGEEAAKLEAQSGAFICKADFKVGTVLEKVANLLEVS